jgi:sensor histidine kinase YesM
MRRRGAHEVTLEEELALLRAYVDIMEARFEGRLALHLDVAADCRNALVPPLLLQPLVENAIKHGIAGREQGGRIEVAARRDGSRLLLSVRDDGPGAGEDGEALLRKGIGLSTTAERLEQLYGRDQALSLRDEEGGGLALTVSLPLRTAPGDGAEGP